MKAGHINQLWAGLLVEELIRCGVTNFVISPGSRSTPLTLAAAENKKASTVIHVDERGCAFFALGLAKATGKAAALICTSGTALANYYPAIVEASLSHTPLLVLSSDRPVEVRDTAAPQTIDQVRIFGNYLRWFFDLPAPTERINPEFVLTTVDQAAFRSRGATAGPVQLNCQLPEPLAPRDTDRDWRQYLAPIDNWLSSNQAYTTYCAADGTIATADLAELVKRISAAEGGMIVAGDLPTCVDAGAVAGLAATLNWPLAADISSGLRFVADDSHNILAHYDLYLKDRNFRASLQPDLILHFGGLPTSKALNEFIKNSGAEVIVVQSHAERQDPSHVVRRRYQADPVELARALTEAVTEKHSAVLERMIAAERATVSLLEEQMPADGNLTEIATAQTLLKLAPPDTALFLGNSMPIRNADSFGARHREKLHVAVNRGANGIDGSIATAAGLAAGLNRRTSVLLGDLALLHDLNSLALVARSAQPVTVVVINNDGGGIFNYLPVAGSTEHFERFFGTPHGFGFESVAEMFGLEYHQPVALADFEAAYRQSQSSSKSSVIEVRSNRAEGRSEHERILGLIQEALTDLP